jgi:hypothetical protein
MPSWMRALALVAVTMAVWLIGKPAAAAAPLCDERGATTLAPPPTLDAPVASIDVGDTGDGCARLAVDRDIAYSQGRGSDPSPAPSHSDLTIDTDAPRVVRPLSAIVPSAETRLVHRPGVRTRLERPPRA